MMLDIVLVLSSKESLGLVLKVLVGMLNYLGFRE